MLISWKWLQNMAETGDTTASEAAARITARGLEVEGHTPDPTCIADIKVAKLIKIVEHPNSDHLHLVDADAGTGELIRVVCGAPGIEEGWVVPLHLLALNSAISKSKNQNSVAKNPTVCCAAKEN